MLTTFSAKIPACTVQIPAACDERIKMTGVNIAWIDPDTTYQDDVWAYNSAVQDMAEKLAGQTVREGLPQSYLDLEGEPGDYR